MLWLWQQNNAPGSNGITMVPGPVLNVNFEIHCINSVPGRQRRRQPQNRRIIKELAGALDAVFWVFNALVYGREKIPHKACGVIPHVINVDVVGRAG